jgi:predicted Rossmann fold flavoprotein
MLAAMETYDVVVIGAGAAGMMCAREAGRRGRRVALLERSPVIGRKIRISGGGRCNFTNTGASPEQYLSANPHFCRSALSRYTPEDFLQLVRAHGIAFHEKTLGQQFCDGPAQQIIDMMLAECRAAGVELVTDCRVSRIERAPEGFRVHTSAGDYAAASLVIATGGLSLPKVGATDFGYRVAKQFGLKIVETAPALDAFVFSAKDQQVFGELSGVSAPAVVTCGGVSFPEAVLFTHTGLSGPAALQASLYWRPKAEVRVDLLPGMLVEALLDWFAKEKARGSRADVKTLLAERLPKRVAARFCELAGVEGKPLAQQPASALQALGRQLKAWTFVPHGTVGYRTAEVTRGGVDTDELSSKTMEAKKVPGLYFIGEVVDVTGWLGGYNFQWAWASGWAAGQVV